MPMPLYAYENILMAMPLYRFLHPACLWLDRKIRYLLLSMPISFILTLTLEKRNIKSKCVAKSDEKTFNEQ